ncbi:MAG TPA: hypothetical protein VGM10_03255 [Actinocrinis sp.]|jgi:hypothetical protein
MSANSGDTGAGAAADRSADPEPQSLWPIGDGTATAMMGLFEVELRKRGGRWRVLAPCAVEIDGLAAGAGQGAVAGNGNGASGAAGWWRADLTPLRAAMAARPKAEWPELVERFVAGLTQPAAARTAPSRSPRSGWQPVGAAAPDLSPLRTRILPSHGVGGLRRPVAEGLDEVVVTEPLRDRTSEDGDPLLGGAAAYGAGGGQDPASEGALVGAGLSEHLLFEAARRNVRGAGPLEKQCFAVEGAQLVALFGPTHYTATHVLWLEEYTTGLPAWDPDHGALVAVPHRHLIALHLIESSAVVHAAGVLLRFAARQYETCPGPISDQLYWWRGGTLTRLPSDSAGETLHLFPTERFAALLDRLGRDE